MGKDYHGLNITVPGKVQPHVNKFLEPSLHNSRTSQQYTLSLTFLKGKLKQQIHVCSLEVTDFGCFSNFGGFMKANVIQCSAALHARS